jgi:hypothetical protein
LSSTADGYKWDDGTNAGKLAIEDGKLKFMDADGNPVEITVLTATGDKRTVEVKGSEFTVMACDVTSSFQMGVPATTNDKGALVLILGIGQGRSPVITCRHVKEKLVF